MAARSITSIKSYASSIVAQAATIQLGCLTIDPSTKSGKRVQFGFLLLLVLVPVIGFLFFVGVELNRTTLQKAALDDVYKHVTKSKEIGGLIHSLQFERIVSTYYITLYDTSFSAYTADAYANTDNALASITSWPSDFEDDRVANIDAFRQLLAWIRENSIDLLELNSQRNTYSEMINLFLDYLSLNTVRMQHSSLWKQLVAYEELLKAKEHFGIQLTGGTYFFLRGHFYSDDYYQNSIEMEKAGGYLTAAFQYASLLADTFATIFENTTTKTNIDEMNDLLMTNTTDTFGISSSAPADWFNDMSRLLNSIYYLIGILQVDIFDELRNESYNANRDIVIAIVLCVLILLLTPITISLVYVMVNRIHGYSLEVVHMTVDIQKEKKRSDQLLFQMLPKSVASQLINNQPVKAEYFGEVTILFSEVTGFAELSDRMPPFEVVNFLNDLYNFIDTKIDHYDVYKVETIRDVYMVVSGLPKRNGLRHAGEIASLALDMMGSVNRFAIPTLPDERLLIRIGIHTGPCMAGIVGTLMPRYCLFGDTVNTASRMESHGLPMKIHVSSSSKEALDRLGGFVIESRGVIAVKGKGDIATYWLEAKVSH